MSTHIAATVIQHSIMELSIDIIVFIFDIILDIFVFYIDNNAIIYIFAKREIEP